MLPVQATDIEFLRTASGRAESKRRMRHFAAGSVTLRNQRSLEKVLPMTSGNLQRSRLHTVLNSMAALRLLNLPVPVGLSFSPGM